MTRIEISDLSFYYSRQPVLSGISGKIASHGITAISGRSGIGKTTLLMTMNRLWEEIPGGRMTGSVQIRLNGSMIDVYGGKIPKAELRRRVGMVFQHPNPLPMSIFRNMAFGLRVAGVTSRRKVREKVEAALQSAGLWNEVKDRLGDDARKLSGGQQQRLCIARALITDPEVLLLDEPTASLDDRAAEKIENLMLDLKKGRTIVMVSHDMQQVARLADHVWRLPPE